MSKLTTLDSSWRDWVMTNLRRGSSRESMVSAMVAKDFDPEFATSVVAALAAEIGCAAGELARATSLEGNAPIPVNGHAVITNMDAVLKADRLPMASVLVTSDRAVPVLARLTKPEVLVLSDVLSHEECSELIQRSEEKLARSTTVDPQTGKEIVIENRSSFGTFFHLNENDFIANIDRRLSELLRWPVDHSEGIQILRYQVGGEYRPHFDYFPPENSGSGSHLSQGGQRIGTLVMYLNDVDEGGETIFPEIGLSVIPRRGHAVYFGYLNSSNEVDPLTLRGGASVRRGVKWIATKWLRQHRRG